MHAPGAQSIAPASPVEGGLRADHQLRTDAGTTRCLFRTGACRRQCHNRTPGAEGEAEGAAAEGDSEARKTRQVEAVQAKAMPMSGTYKALPVDACAGGKVCYKGITLTFGGWVDLTGIYRSRNIASDTGSVYNFIPYQQSPQFLCRRRRGSPRAQSRFSVLAEGNADPDTHLAGYGEIDFEGAAQTASSVATNSFNPRMRQLSLEVDRTDLGLHFLAGQSWSLNSPGKVGHRSPRRRCARRDRLRIRSRDLFPRGNPVCASGRTSGRSSSWPRRSRMPRPHSSAATSRLSAPPPSARRAC